MQVSQMITEKEEGEEITSQPQTRQATINRDREGAHDRLVADHFADEPLYTAAMFRRQFRMSSPLFLQIANDRQKGFHHLTEMHNGNSPNGIWDGNDAWDEYLKIFERTARECLYNFCKCVV
ncbi:uncharacterized protein LOC118482703 [Helianthus annuus]|uniref:uncharacterized protein LOC118482703 n=1 Tax=Helianthus annuus TaxID=4232 RepID=UPI0016533CF6|nr:uncharacterized protein LOC118482703 [Helianthus annuus]